jgi:GNAT superfamily N-acetyltransferase
MVAASAFTIRSVTREDFAQWLPLWEGYNAFYGRSGQTALARPLTDTTWQRFFDPDEPVHALVAQDGARLVGLVHYIFHRSSISIGPVCYLQDLFTAVDLRGRGVGGSLIRAVCDQAKAAGASRVYWHTHETNATARRLYDQLAEQTGFIMYRMTW